MTSKLYHNEDDHEKFEESYRKVFFYIGKCTTRYQSIEDNLEKTCIAVSKLSAASTSAVFGIARSLEDRLRLISALILDKDEELAELWENLRPRIKRTFDQRNLIAHGTPVSAGRGVVLSFDESTDSVKILGYGSEYSQLKLQKATKSSHLSWDFKELCDLSEEFHGVWLNLITFDMIAEGKPIPEHFAAAWDNEIVERWPQKPPFVKS